MHVHACMHALSLALCDAAVPMRALFCGVHVAAVSTAGVDDDVDIVLAPMNADVARWP